MASSWTAISAPSWPRRGPVPWRASARPLGPSGIGRERSSGRPSSTRTARAAPLVEMRRGSRCRARPSRRGSARRAPQQGHPRHGRITTACHRALHPGRRQPPQHLRVLAGMDDLAGRGQVTRGLGFVHGEVGDQAKIGTSRIMADQRSGPAAGAPGDDGAGDLVGADAHRCHSSLRSAAEVAGATSVADATARNTRAAAGAPSSRPCASPVISLASSARPTGGCASSRSAREPGRWS